MSGTIVQAADLQKIYYGKVEVPVLFGIDLTVCEGEFLAVMGQSGSGKSTLLNILGCLDRPTGGTLRIAGQDVSELDDNGLAKLRSERIGFIFQFHFLLDEFTCLENVLLPVLIREGDVTSERRNDAIHLLRRVGLGHRLRNTPDMMSGGENQRCAIVRALANRPRLILADEPTGNLDSRSGQEVFRLFRELSAETGVAVVMVTHDERLARAADRVVAIEDGHIREVTEQISRGGSLYEEVKPRPVLVEVDK